MPKPSTIPLIHPLITARVSRRLQHGVQRVVGLALGLFLTTRGVRLRHNSSSVLLLKDKERARDKKGAITSPAAATKVLALVVTRLHS